jgi:hypothetical protein
VELKFLPVDMCFCEATNGSIERVNMLKNCTKKSMPVKIPELRKFGQ